MIRILGSLFLAAHGLVHLLYLAPKPEDDPRYPFAPEGSWVIRGLSASGAKSLSTALGVMTAAILVLAGVSVLLDAGWWKATAIAGAASSLLVLAIFFHPWLSFGVAIDAAIIATVLWWHWPRSLFD